MSTLAERSASETFEQFYGEVPIDPVIALGAVDFLSTNLQISNQSRLVEEVGSFQQARTELTAASLLQERFGVPLCLEAVQPFLVLLSKQQEAIDWERMSAQQLIDQLQAMLHIAVNRLAVLATARQQHERQLASLQTTKKHLQEDPVHESVSAAAVKTKQQVGNTIDEVTYAITGVEQESALLEKAVVELSALQRSVGYQLRAIGNVSRLAVPTEVNELLQM